MDLDKEYNHAKNIYKILKQDNFKSLNKLTIYDIVNKYEFEKIVNYHNVCKFLELRLLSEECLKSKWEKIKKDRWIYE